MMKMVATVEELIEALQENNQIGNMEIICQEGAEWIYIGPSLVISKPVKIEGNGMTIAGNGQICFAIRSSDVEINNMIFRQFNRSISVDGYGSEIQNILIHHCEFHDVCGYAIEVVSSKSNSKIRQVRIEDNMFTGRANNTTEESHGRKMFIVLGAGKAEEGIDVVDTELSEVIVARNSMKLSHRVSISICAAMLSKVPEGVPMSTIINPVIRNIKIVDNILHGAWDATISVAGGYLQQVNAIAEDIEISNNEIIHGIWALFVTGIVPIVGEVKTGKVVDVRILDNQIEGDPNVCGEVQYAIACAGSRTAFLPHVHSSNTGIERIQIKGNTIRNTDYEIFIAGEDLVMDVADTSICNCFVKDIEITENKLYDVIDAFTFCGGFVEGRMFDWNIGLPPHNQKWGEVPSADMKTYICEGNRIENLLCVNNYVKGNRYKYRIYGALAHGHGVLKNNQIMNVKIYDNVFQDTEGHIHVANLFADGWCEDLGGNVVEVDLNLL